MALKHGRIQFKANIKGSDYDFMVFIYAPGAIDHGRIKHKGDRKIYVFPQETFESTPKG